MLILGAVVNRHCAPFLFSAAMILAACGDNLHPPTEVSSGRITAQIYSDPAQIVLRVDGAIAWQTERGGGNAGSGAPNGFAAIGPVDVTITMEFGSFELTEATSSEVWTTIDKLGAITPTATGASFELRNGDTKVGTGTLDFDTALTAGPNPGAAGFPGHVRITLFADTGDRISLATPCGATEHFAGLGGQSYDVDHHGQTVPLWVQEDGIGKDPTPDDQYSGIWFLTGRRHSTHSPQPMLLSSQGYALAVDTNARAVFALCSEQPDVARFEAWEPTLDLNVFIGDVASPRDALGLMDAWVGKPATPPATVFAPWIDAIMGSASVRQVAGALRSNGISSSVIWTEDWRGGGEGTTGYAITEDWRVDRTLYPDFEQLAADLHSAGFAFATYNNTFLDSAADIYAEATGDGYALHDGNGATYTFMDDTFAQGSMVDLTNPAAVAYTKSVYSEGVALGADGWMADFGEWQPTDATLASGESALAVHNRYPVDWAQLNHDLLASAPAGRPAPIYFMRSAWLHSQSLVQVLWPGDQQTDFSDGDGFPSVVPMGIGLGVTGFPYFGSDVAGYMSQGTTPTTEELFYRWVTFGALSPVMRTHHGRSAEQNFQWQHDASSIAHFRRWARFHMQLAAYLQGSIGSFERDGLPLFRLTALEYPGEDWAWTATDEYMLGDRILVAPVNVQGATSRPVQLPTGTWYPLLGGAATSGAITANATTTEIPAFVPAGSLLVLYPDGVDSTIDATGVVSLSTIGGDREVWLYPGSADDPARAGWNDAVGAAGTAQWTWSGGGALPTAATWNGAAVTVTPGVGYVTITVVGDGTLQLDSGGSLVIARGLPTANVTLRVYGG